MSARRRILKLRKPQNTDIQPVIEESWPGVDQFGNPIQRTVPATKTSKPLPNLANMKLTGNKAQMSKLVRLKPPEV